KALASPVVPKCRSAGSGTPDPSRVAWGKHRASEKFTTLSEFEWASIRKRVREVARPAVELEQVLKAAGAPTTPAALGWPEEAYRDALDNAWQSRDRFTFLDFALR